MDCAYKVRRQQRSMKYQGLLRVSGRVLPCSVSGCKPYLSSEEEDELVSFLVGCAEIDFPRGRKEFIALVQRTCDGRGLGSCIHGWWEHFCCRHQDLSLRVTAPLSRARIEGSDPTILNAYFDMLETTSS